jgi:hypothetical protein
MPEIRIQSDVEKVISGSCEIRNTGGYFPSSTAGKKRGKIFYA